MYCSMLGFHSNGDKSVYLGVDRIFARVQKPITESGSYTFCLVHMMRGV